MTLMHASALWAAAGLLVPIAIHLHRKRRARVVNWPAMQFLTRTVASRRRGLSLENLLLLFVRCLVITLFVLAMTRPLLPPQRMVASLLTVLLLTGGVAGLAVTAIRSLRPRTRSLGLVAAGVLLTAAGTTFTTRPPDILCSTENCDLVIVIDESSSMLREDVEESPFARAVADAASLVDRLCGSSTVSIVRSGPVMETVAGSPFHDLTAARRTLLELTPTGGGGHVGEAVDQAEALARQGANPRRQIVLFTDNQLRTWESLGERAFRGPSTDSQTPASSTGSVVDSPPAAHVAPTEERPEEQLATDRVPLAVQLAKLPQQCGNICVVSTQLGVPIPAVDQPLQIEVVVRNEGPAAVEDVAVELLIDEAAASVETIDVLPAATSRSVRFSFTFDKAGQHIVTARTDVPDLLQDDNRADTVVSVVPFVSVLLVNGNAFADSAAQSATFLQLALDPLNQPAGDRENAGIRRPIRVDCVEVPTQQQLNSLADYDVVVLCDVPQLPQDIAGPIARYVENGGGLWIIPDRHASAAFYNGWQREQSGDPLLPVVLQDEPTVRPSGDEQNLPKGIDVPSVGSGVLSDLMASGEHDLADVMISDCRSVTLRETAVVGMRLTSGEPMFVEQSCGRGRVLVQTVALAEDSNLPRCVCFPVLTHLWTCYLASDGSEVARFEPTPELSLPLHGSELPGTTTSLRLTDPAGAVRAVPVVNRSPNAVAQIQPAGRPGVYRLRERSGPDVVQSFTIARDLRESNLEIISDEKLAALQRTHEFQVVENTQELRIAAAGESTPWDLSPYLLGAVLCLIAAESLLTAWVRARRGRSLPVPPSPQTSTPTTPHRSTQRPSRAVKHRRKSAPHSTPAVMTGGRQ